VRSFELNLIAEDLIRFERTWKTKTYNTVSSFFVNHDSYFCLSLIDHLNVAPLSMQFVSRFPRMFGIRQPFETDPRIICDAPCWRSSTSPARHRAAKMNVTSRLESYAFPPMIGMKCSFVSRVCSPLGRALVHLITPWVHCKTLNCLESSSAPPNGAAETWDLG
jgi:hypothetical protein